MLNNICVVHNIHYYIYKVTLFTLIISPHLRHTSLYNFYVTCILRMHDIHGYSPVETLLLNTHLQFSIKKNSI